MGYENPFVAHRLIMYVGIFLGAALLLGLFHWTRPPPCDEVDHAPCRDRDLLDDLLSTEPLPRSR